MDSGHIKKIILFAILVYIIIILLYSVIVHPLIIDVKTQVLSYLSDMKYYINSQSFLEYIVKTH